MSKFFAMPFGRVYPLYVAKLARKGRSQAELDEVITWLTGYDAATVHRMVDDDTTFAEFFDSAHLNPGAILITGMICGVRVELIEEPLLRNIRCLDKLVDELARGKAMGTVLRQSAPTG